MRIRTLFLTTLTIACAILAVMSVSVALTEREVAALNQQVQVADDIERGAGDLSYLASQYLLYRQDQGRTLWWARFTSFSDDVSHLSPADAEGATLAASIRANREQLQTVFSEVSLAVQARSAGQGAAAPDSAFLQLSWSRIEAVDQAMLLDASRLAGQLRGAGRRLAGHQHRAGIRAAGPVRGLRDGQLLDDLPAHVAVARQAARRGGDRRRRPAGAHDTGKGPG